jgi:PAS domain S-box-containing protein
MSDDDFAPSEGSERSTWSWNVATGEVTWSEGIEQALFGLPKGGFGGTFEAYLALVHPDDRSYFQALIARTLEGEDEYVMSHRVVWPDGSIRWIDGRGRLTRDREGRPLVLTGIAWTAATRRRADAKLTHLSRVRAVASAVSRELLRVDREDGVFEQACKIAVEHGHFRFAWVGILSRADARVRPVARAGTEDGYLEEIAVTFDLTPQGRGPVGISIREGRPVVMNDIAHDEGFAPWRAPALRRGYCGCAAFPLRRGGEVVGALVIYAEERNRFDADQIELLRGLADDIGFKLDALDADARRRSAEDAMRRSEERYRALVEQAADGIFLADGAGSLIEVNGAACALTGLSRAQLLGRDLGALFESTKPGEQALPLGAEPGTRFAGERRLRRRDGKPIDSEVTAIVLEDGRVQVYARDVTQRKIVQQQLILADRLTSLGRLAAGVAHEINNPLAYVALNLDLIERESAASPEVHSAAQNARDGAERVRDIVRALGAFSRQDEAAIGAVDLHRVLDSAIRLSENEVRQRSRILKEYRASHRVRGNELRLGQVFVNLVINASDALPDRSPDENEIQLRTFDDGDRVVVEVRDNGCGIAPEIIGRIFDPFFTTKPVGQGTGLGLSISHGIVTAFGGRIDVESQLGKGTAFRVSLIADALAGSESPPTPQRTQAPPVRLLIVDDEVLLARTLAASLDRHEVTVTTRGREALLLARTRSFDCIVCDLTMPEISGMDLHAELAREGRGIERRIVFMTGGAFTSRAQAFAAEVSNEVLEKPFPVARLESAIARVLEREGVAK